MSQSGVVQRSFLIVIASLGWLGILLQLWISARLSLHHGYPVLRGALQALCYFTVLTNILTALIATAASFGKDARGFFRATGTLAAAAVYILVVGLIYSLLLRSQWAPVGLHQPADEILHDVTPILFVLWWACTPQNTVSAAVNP